MFLPRFLFCSVRSRRVVFPTGSSSSFLPFPSFLSVSQLFLRSSAVSRSFETPLILWHVTFGLPRRRRLGTSLPPCGRARRQLGPSRERRRRSLHGYILLFFSLGVSFRSFISGLVSFNFSVYPSFRSLSICYCVVRVVYRLSACRRGVCVSVCLFVWKYACYGVFTTRNASDCSDNGTRATCSLG